MGRRIGRRWWGVGGEGRTGEWYVYVKQQQLVYQEKRMYVSVDSIIIPQPVSLNMR